MKKRRACSTLDRGREKWKKKRHSNQSYFILFLERCQAGERDIDDYGQVLIMSKGQVCLWVCIFSNVCKGVYLGVDKRTCGCGCGWVYLSFLLSYKSV